MRKAVAGTLLVCAVALTGCGGGGSPAGSSNGEASKSAKQVLADAVKAAAAASSVHISGRASKVELDLTIIKGKGAMGTMTLKGQKVEFVIDGRKGYMKAGAAFWRQFAGPSGNMFALRLVANKWLKFPTSNPQMRGFVALGNSKAFFKKMSSDHGTLENKGATTYKGQSAVDIFDESKTDGGDLYIAAAGTPYPLGFHGAAGAKNGGDVTFGDWNEPIVLIVPDHALDVSAFLHMHH